MTQTWIKETVAMVEAWNNRPMDIKRVDKAMWLRQCVANCDNDRWSWDYYDRGIKFLEKLHENGTQNTGLDHGQAQAEAVI